MLTQYQLEKLLKADSRTGFFYGDYKVLYCVAQARSLAFIARPIARPAKSTPSRCSAPIRRASYEFEHRSGPSLMEVLSGVVGLGAR